MIMNKSKSHSQILNRLQLSFLSLLIIPSVVCAVAKASPEPSPDVVTVAGLVAAYNFDEGSGLMVNDLSGNGNNGTITGATFTAGKFGGGLSFDGISNWVTVNDATSLDLTSGMTL